MHEMSCLIMVYSVDCLLIEKLMDNLQLLNKKKKKQKKPKHFAIRCRQKQKWK